MKTIIKVSILVLLLTMPALAQPPESFFPHNVGDRWDYQDLNSGQIFTIILTRDSIGADGSHNLFYNNSLDPAYRIDTLSNVFWAPEQPYGNWLLYKLTADSGEAWCYDPPVPPCNWAYVHGVDSTVVFGRRTVVKTFCYDPAPPGGGGWCWFAERRLASGFGLIYEWRMQNNIIYLRGCIIAGDTFGIVTSVVDQIGNEIPASFYLHPNYPNPFNVETIINYQIPVDNYVTLKVYNVLGQEATTLVDGYKEAGYHSVSFNAVSTRGGFPSGIYFYRLQAGSFTSNKKMLLAR